MMSRIYLGAVVPDGFVILLTVLLTVGETRERGQEGKSVKKRRRHNSEGQDEQEKEADTTGRYMFYICLFSICCCVALRALIILLFCSLFAFCLVSRFFFLLFTSNLPGMVLSHLSKYKR